MKRVNPGMIVVASHYWRGLRLVNDFKTVSDEFAKEVAVGYIYICRHIKIAS